MTQIISQIPTWALLAPLVVLMALTLAVVLERLLYFGNRKLNKDFFEVLASLVVEGFDKGEFSSAQKYCQREKSPVAQALQHCFSVVVEIQRKSQQWVLSDNQRLPGLQPLDSDLVTPGPEQKTKKNQGANLEFDRQWIKDALVSSVRVSGGDQIAMLEKNLPILSTIATIAPLFGLLGTVTGMLKAFHSLSQSAMDSISTEYAAGVASGITEALITTFLGLVVAIPAYIFFNYFISRISFFTREMEKGVFFLSDTVLSLILARKNGD